MIRDSIILIMATFVLIVTYIGTSMFVFDVIDSVTDEAKNVTTQHNEFFLNLNTTLKGVYSLMFVAFGGGIIFWYYNRMHREEYDVDIRRMFESPEVPEIGNWDKRW